MNECEKQPEECFLNLESSDEIPVIYPASPLPLPPISPSVFN